MVKENEVLSNALISEAEMKVADIIAYTQRLDRRETAMLTSLHEERNVRDEDQKKLRAHIVGIHRNL
jgi:hypothetical protein